MASPSSHERKGSREVSGGREVNRVSRGQNMKVLGTVRPEEKRKGCLALLPAHSWLDYFVCVHRLSHYAVEISVIFYFFGNAMHRIAVRSPIFRFARAAFGDFEHDKSTEDVVAFQVR